MRTIWKFKLALPTGAVAMPVGAQIIDAAIVGDGPGHFEMGLWAIVDTEADPETRAFQVFRTGVGLPTTPTAHRYTWHENGYVWHLFELYDTDVPRDLPKERHADYRLLIDDGFTLRHDKAWLAPDDAPPGQLGHDQIVAITRLQEHGYGSVVSP